MSQIPQNYSLAESIELNPFLIPVTHALSDLKQDSIEFGIFFNQFKDQILNQFNKDIGRISSFIQREQYANKQLKEQLTAVKYSNQSMCKEVVQLREMINDCVKSYNFQLENKQTEIRHLKMQLGQFVEDKLIQEDGQQENKNNCLEVIQEVSEGTGSCLQSVRQLSMPNSAKDSVIPVNIFSNFSETHDDSWAEEDKINKSRSFLNFFRRTVDESQNPTNDKEYSRVSQLSSIEEGILEENDNINLPKSIKSPKNMEFFKKKQPIVNISVQEKQNSYCTQMKKTPHKRNHSEGDDRNQSRTSNEKYSRSNSKTGSKQKIKITSKMVEQYQPFNPKNPKKAVNARPSVHLGGRSYLKKIIKEVKIALQELKIWQGSVQKQVRYEGQKRNGNRHGKGRLLYDSGFQFEGNFVENYRHGSGKVCLNGIIFYEGDWSLNEISGQGYIKSFRHFNQNCPKYLWQASYCGQLLQNRLHGLGTLFLNQNEKIVTKFVQGMPVGELTYYHRNQIDFGCWN